MKIFCLICGSQNIEKYQAKIHPFICERIKKGDAEIALINCNKCDFVFFDYRLSSEEVNDLYYNYRDKKYQECRQKYDKSYSFEINEFIGKDSNEIAVKKQNILTAIERSKIDLNKVESVLDFGGDSGQNIDLDIFNLKNKYLFDVSDAKPVAGVKKLQSISPNESFDFVVSQHVLEHVSDPLEMLKTNINLLRKGGFFYFELPMDSPFLKRDWKLIIKRIMWVLSFVLDFKKRDYDVGFGKIILRKIHWLFLIVSDLINREKRDVFLMHEHINFFNKRSVEKMLEISGLKLLYLDSGYSDYSKLIYGIAQKI